MLIPILATKLYIPHPRPNVVLRPHLIEQLNQGLQNTPGVTLISAPAGYGKTTLVSEWVAGGDRPVAWLSLDERDNDPTQFLAYIVTAIQSIAPNFGASILGVLQSPQPPPAESSLTALINLIATTLDNFILVLDDYHVIDSKPVDDALTYLLEHLPPQLHLVITSREDPNLSFTRLRGHGQLTELRVTDLRFSPSETSDFLDKVMGLTLSAENISALEARTEGWIAGLQLAALSILGHQDVSGFIQGFTGDHRYIVDYLVEEVLKCQPEPLRSFLLQTAILDRLSGPLCDAVTGRPGAKARLETLQHGNFFLIPLDDERHWYRYHHLFADVLRMHLMTEQTDLVPVLHRRASEWFEQNGLMVDAIHHALIAEDFERAADLIERSAPAIRRNRQEAMFLGWLQSLPGELVRCRPVLSVHYAGALLLSGKLDDVESRLQDAERWLDTTADLADRSVTLQAEMVVADKAELRRLPGWIVIYRSAIALALGDVASTKRYARRALDLVLDEDHLGRGAAAGLLGLAYWTSGDLEAAHRAYADSMARMQMVGHISDTIGLAIALADILIAQGRLREAMGTFEWGLQLATKQGTPVLRGAADMYVGMSEIYREHDDLKTAMQHLQISKELGEFMGLSQYPYRWRVAMARIWEAQGDLDGALGQLQEAERLYMSDFSPTVRPIAALKTRMWVAQGKLGEALGWARAQGLSAEDKLSYLLEFEHIILARILLAQFKSDRTDSSIREAIGLLGRLLKAAEDGGRMGSAIEILVLQALAHQALGEIPTALLPLERALTLAEPEGYVRMFVDEGSSMALLLTEAAARGIKHDYVSKLLVVFEADEHKNEPRPILPAALPEDHWDGESPNEPLSQRELEVLRLIARGLSNRKISEQLFLALNTVKGHNQKIYSKLQAQNRTEAVARARELDLL